jgi:hypothetical protein
MAPPSDAALVRYLLGHADREDEERFDELSVTDAPFAERLRAVEHDLADAYVRGELSPPDRERWETRYLASQHGRDDLAVAKALLERERRDTRGSWRLWGLALAAGLLLAVAGYRLMGGRQPTPAKLQPAPSTTSTSAAVPQAPPAVAHVVALTLTPSVRSLGEVPTLTIPRGTTDVKLTLRLDADEFKLYTIALRDLTSNTVVWSSSETAAEGEGANRALVVTIPSSTLQTRRYLITASAGPSNAREIVATYPLVVVLQ